MNDQIIELTKYQLRVYLLAAWRSSSYRATPEESLEDSEKAFEEWYEDGEWIIGD